MVSSLIRNLSSSAALDNSPPEGIMGVWLENDNLFEWGILIIGPPGSYYEDGQFRAKIKFPADFPNSPPQMKFETPIIHPNVYENGSVCISILHPPGTCASLLCPAS